MSRVARLKGSQGRLLPVFSPLDFNQRSKGEAVMSNIIEFQTRTLRPASVHNLLPSMINVYPCKNGKTGIDACVSADVAAEMHGTEFLPGMLSYFRGNNGMIGFDARVSAPVAERMLAAAKRAGASIRQ